MRQPLSIIIVASMLLLTGCTSVWKSTFVPSPGATTSAPLDQSATIRVRELDWQRLQQGIGELQARVAASNAPVEEWSESEKADLKAALLRILQVTDDPSSVTILGRSDFRTTQSYRLETADQPDLIAFARSIGATQVIWSRGYLGKADTIVSEPVHTWGWGNDPSWDRRHGRWRGGSYADSSTTFVPVRIEADEFAYYAYFLRAR